MGTKNNPGAFDCYAKAEPDEEMFVLLARDTQAPTLVRAWAWAREEAIADGFKPASDMPMVLEARRCADAMDHWRRARRERKAS